MKTLSANYYFYILKIIEGMGLNRAEVAHIVPLELEINPDPKIRIEMRALQDLFIFAEDKLGDPHVGMHVSHNFRISNYGYAGGIYAMCDNIEHSMALSRKYGCLAHTFGEFLASPTSNLINDTVTYIWSPYFELGNDTSLRQITECVVMNYALTINWLAWSFPEGIKKITFRHRATEPISEYSKILGCEVEFGAEVNSLVLDRSAHAAPLPTANPIKLSKLQTTLNQRLAAYAQSSDLTPRVKQSIQNIIELQRPTLSLVAQQLSLSERTLKRHLRAEDTSFQSVLRELKMELCAGYMKEGLAFSEIAQRLWYFDQSALTRAYKSWHGIAPTHHRKN